MAKKNDKRKLIGLVSEESGERIYYTHKNTMNTPKKFKPEMRTNIAKAQKPVFLEEKSRLSRSLLWQIQRKFFDADIPCLVVAREKRLSNELMGIAEQAGISVFQSSMLTMKFLNAATIRGGTLGVPPTPAPASETPASAA